MKVLVPSTSIKVLDLLSEAQKAQISQTTPANSPEKAYMFQVMTSSETVYFENGGEATVTDSMPHAEGEGKFIIPAEGFSELHVIGSTDDVEMIILTC